MAQTRREKKSEETGALWLAVMREMLRGSGVAVAVTLLALLACALLVSNGTIGEEMMDRAVLAVCVLGSLTGGLTAVRRIRRSPLPVGLGGRLSVPADAVGGMPALRLRLCIQ